MNLFKRIPLPFGGRDYEIRVLYDERIINVVAFANNHPVNGYRYQVQVPKGSDAKGILQRHPVPELVEKCKDDIIRKRWDPLSQIIQDL
jgi:hypothetical protein